MPKETRFHYLLNRKLSMLIHDKFFEFKLEPTNLKRDTNYDRVGYRIFIKAKDGYDINDLPTAKITKNLKDYFAAFVPMVVNENKSFITEVITEDEREIEYDTIRIHISVLDIINVELADAVRIKEESLNLMNTLQIRLGAVCEILDGFKEQMVVTNEELKAVSEVKTIDIGREDYNVSEAS